MGLENNEILQEEPTPAEIADACRVILEPKVCDEIAIMDLEEALSLAFTALAEAGENPDEFLKSKNILE